jgi:hypothetical protein
MVKKLLLVIILISGVFTLWMPAEARLTTEQSSLPTLVNLLMDHQGTVQGIELQGWASLENRDPAEMARSVALLDGLGLSGSAVIPLEDGGLLLQKSDCRSTMRVALKKIKSVNGCDLCYILISCQLPGYDRSGTDWEQKIRRTLASLGGQHGLYINVEGRLPACLARADQRAWARAIYHELGGRITTTVATDRYLSLGGYTPLFHQPAQVGRQQVNLSMALVCSGSQETHVYLGTPLITIEY